MISIGIIFVVNLSFILINDAKSGEISNIVILPVALFGLGHAMFVTL